MDSNLETASRHLLRTMTLSNTFAQIGTFWLYSLLVKRVHTLGFIIYETC